MATRKKTTTAPAQESHDKGVCFACAACVYAYSGNTLCSKFNKPTSPETPACADGEKRL